MTTKSQVDEFFDEVVKENDYLYWSRKAYRGDPDAQLTMGLFYEFGGVKGVIKNDNTALYWYRLAAKSGLPSAVFQYNRALNKLRV